MQTLFTQPQQSLFTIIPHARVKLIRERDIEYTLRDQILNPANAYTILNHLIGDEDREHLIIIMLDTKRRVICTHTAAIGSHNAAYINTADILRAALLAGADSICLGHNHPSGDPTPSPEDIRTTKQIATAAELLDIDLLDHVIVGHNRYTSLKELSLI